jgi:hypothetical protein
MTDSEPLRDTASDVVTNHARVTDPEEVEQFYHALCVRADSHWPAKRAIASAIAEQVDDHNAVAGRNEGNDIGPEVARSWKAVEEHHRLPRAACAGRVVIQANAVQIDKFTAHGDPQSRERVGAEDTPLCPQ